MRAIIRPIERGRKGIVLLVPWAQLIDENLVARMPRVRQEARHSSIWQHLFLAVATIENQLTLGRNGTQVIEVSRNNRRIHLLHRCDIQSDIHRTIPQQFVVRCLNRNHSAPPRFYWPQVLQARE